MLPSKRAPRVSLFATLLAMLSLSACMPATRIPIDTILYNNGAAQGSHMLFVYLPGRGDDMTAFQDNGLIDAVRKHGLDVDVIAVNAHMGYYMNGTAFTRIREDVIGPARAKGYERIWLIGNSLGGYGSLSYARQYPDDIEGIVLLGPFLGNQALIDEISRAGLLNWRPVTIKKDTEDEWDKQLWLWIKDRVEQKTFGTGGIACIQEKKSCGPKIYMGYGRSDRFADAQEFLASLLPQDHVFAIEGGHRWGTWKKNWAMVLDNKIFSTMTRTAPIAPGKSQ
jgi:pimeloyl-ACP methyl ester carboxylesterase